MKEKSLDEILKRNDYVRLVPVLYERAVKIVNLLKTKLRDLDLSSITIEVDRDFYEFVVTELEPEGNREYACLKFGKVYRILENSPYPYYDNMKPCNNHDYIFLLNHAREFIEQISLCEDGLVESVKNALTNTQDL